MFSLKQHVRRHAMVLPVSAAVFGLAATSYAADSDSLTDGGRTLKQSDAGVYGTSSTHLNIYTDTYTGGTHGHYTALGGVQRVEVSDVGDKNIYVDPGVDIGFLFIDGSYHFKGTFKSTVGNGGIWLYGNGCNVTGTGTGNEYCTFDNVVFSNSNQSSIRDVIVDGTGTVHIKNFDSTSNWTSIRKIGTGTLRFDTITSIGNDTSYDIWQGTLLLTDSCAMGCRAYHSFDTNVTYIKNANGVNMGLECENLGYLSALLVVRKLGTLAGGGSIEGFNTGYVYINGGLAPNSIDSTMNGNGAMPSDAIGTLAINNVPVVYFGEDAHFDLDFTQSKFNDMLKLNSGVVDIDVGATFNFNAIDNFSNGTYDLIFGASGINFGVFSLDPPSGSTGYPHFDVQDFDLATIKFNVFINGIPHVLSDEESFTFSINGGTLSVEIAGFSGNGGTSDVPEPASLALLGLGAGTLLLRRKRS